MNTNASMCSICSICLETHTDITTPCGHTFHRECLKKHVVINTFTCPYCRNEISQFCVDELDVTLDRENNVFVDLEQMLENEIEEDIQDLYRLLCYWDDYVEYQ